MAPRTPPFQNKGASKTESRLGLDQGYEGRPPLDAIVAAPPSANLVSVARSIGGGGGGQGGKDAAQHALQTLQSVTNSAPLLRGG